MQVKPRPMAGAALVAARNWQATAARVLIAPFLFIALIWIVNEALTHGNSRFDANRSVTDPTCVRFRGTRKPSGMLSNR